METKKTGLDDFLLETARQKIDGVELIRRKITETPLFIPLAEGADAFIARRSLPEATTADLINVCAIQLNRSETECLTHIDNVCKGDLKKRALKNDAVQRLKAIKKAQEPIQSTGLKENQDEKYARYMEDLKETDYQIDQSGHLFRISGPAPRERATKIANFVLAIDKEIIIDDGSSEENNRFVEVSGLAAGGIPLPPKTLSVVDFVSARNIMSNYGTRPIIEPTAGAEDYIRHVAQLLGRRAERITKYNHTGWKKIDGDWVFLSAGKALGSKDKEIPMAEGSQQFAAYCFPDGDCDTVQAVRQSLALLSMGPLEITLPLLSFVYLAVLREIFRQAGVSIGFSLFCIGDSGSLKSTLAALFLCHFGRFGRTSLPASFVATANSLERLAFSLKDVVLVIDDRHPTESAREADQMTATFTRLVREFANGSERSRCNPDGSRKASYPPRCMAIFTMELSAAGQSTIARGIELVFHKGMIDMEKLSAAQASSEQLTLAMRGYIEFLAANFDKTADQLGREFPIEREKFTQGMSHGQLPEHLAGLYLGLKNFVDYAVQIGAATESESEQLLTQSRQVFYGLGVYQSQEVASETPVEMMDVILAELFASRAVYVRGLDGGPPSGAGRLGYRLCDEGDPVPPERGDHIGWADETFYYFMPQTMFMALVKFKNGLKQRFPVDLKALCSRLKDAGRLETVNSATRAYNYKKVMCEGVQQSVMVVRRPVHEESGPDQASDKSVLPQLPHEKTISSGSKA